MELNDSIESTYASIARLNPFRYRGYYYDVETGLYYLNSRYYDPELGRFINADDISILNSGKEYLNGLNLYAYCFNNPINDTDENGNWSWNRFWKTVASVATAVVVAAVVTAVCVATVGGAAVAMGATAAVAANFATATAVGGLIAGGVSIVGQGIENGFDNINIGSVAIDAFGGAMFGTITAGVGMTGGVVNKVIGGIGKVALYGTTTALHGINDHLSLEQIGHNMLSTMRDQALLQTVLIATPQLFNTISLKTGKTITHLPKLLDKLLNNSTIKTSIVTLFTGLLKLFRS